MMHLWSIRIRTSVFVSDRLSFLKSKNSVLLLHSIRAGTVGTNNVNQRTQRDLILLVRLTTLKVLNSTIAE